MMNTFPGRLTNIAQLRTIHPWTHLSMPIFEPSRKTWQCSKKLRLCGERAWSRPSSTWCSKNMSACGSLEASAMLLAKKIKLEVTAEDAAALEFMQGKC